MCIRDRFDIDIMEIKPKNDYDAICIIDTDVEVDFAPPLDYEEPSNQKAEFVEQSADSKTGFFAGKGMRIDEKQVKPGQRKVSMNQEEEEYDPRKHRIHRGVRKNTNDFTGKGVKMGVPLGTKKK